MTGGRDEGWKGKGGMRGGRVEGMKGGRVGGMRGCEGGVGIVDHAKEAISTGQELGGSIW